MALSTLQLADIDKIIRQTGYPSLKSGKKIRINTPQGFDRKKLIDALLPEFQAAGYDAVLTKGSSVGTISFNKGEMVIEVKHAGSEKRTMFKPADIKPRIVGVWLDAQTMTNNVLQYLKTLDIADDEREQIANLLHLVSKDGNTNFLLPKFPKDLVPSEFYEVLSAIKLTKLMSMNDRNIRNVLGIPKDVDLSRTKIRINIPTDAAMPLLDYWVNISPTPDEESSMKISVKSKVSSSKSNTVKFVDVFKGTSPDQWYTDLPAAEKPNQVAQKIIANGVLQAYAQGQATRRSQILPLLHLLQSVKRAEVEKVLQQYHIVSTDVPVLIRLLETFNRNMTTLKNETTIDTFVKADDEKALAYKIVMSNLKQSDITVAALCYVFDTITMVTSRKTSPTQYNFYQMFYDEVLKRQRIAYAVSSYSQSTLKFNFYTLINWAKEYDTYVALRIQSSTKGINSSIGLDV